MAKRPHKTQLVHRSAITGRFLKAGTAKRHPRTTSASA
jgi:hypothetical protein